MRHHSAQEEQAKQKAIGKRRRLKIFGAAMVLFICWTSSVWFHQQKELTKQQEELAAIQREVQVAKERQVELSKEIKRLYDLEYIGELARKDYFLSKPGEMIFKISGDED